MANSLNLLRGSGLKTFNSLLRLQTSSRSLLIGRNSTLVRNNALFSNKPNGLSQQIIKPKSLLIDQTRKSTSSATNASSHWKVERYLSVALLGLIPVALLAENNILDYVLATSLVLHSHWGLETIITDYVHGPTMPKVAMAALFVVSALTLAGLFYLNYADIGLTKAVKKIWSL